MKKLRLLLLSLLGLSIFFTVSSLFSFTFASSSDLDPVFDTKTPLGFNSEVYTTLQQSDGKLVVGGHFTRYQGVSANKIIRLNLDGTVDASFSEAIGERFGTTFNAEAVYSIVQQSDGKLIIAGRFVDSPSLVRLNLDGSLDNTFSPPSFLNEVAADGLALASNGDIITSLTWVNGSAIYNLIYRLDSNGNILNSADLSMGFQPDGNIKGAHSIAIQPNGKILVGGDFTTFNGSTANYLVRLESNLAYDSTFDIGNGFDGIVRSVKVQSDGKILVGGEFTSFNGNNTKRIVRLNTNGTIDTGFRIGSGFDANTYNINTQSDGKILVGGNFSSYSGVSIKNLIRLNTNGTIDNTFVSGQINGGVKHINIQNDGKLLIGSLSVNDGYIARLSSAGVKDTTFNIGRGFNGFVYDSIVQSDGKILVGGDFTKYGNLSSQRLIRLNEDASIDTSFNPWTGFNRKVTAIALQSDGKILVGGDFQIGFLGELGMPMVRLNTDGSLDTSFSQGHNLNAYITDIAVLNDGKILVLSSSNGRIARLNSDGSRDYTFDVGVGTGFANTPLTLAVQDDGKILVGGAFPSYQGISSQGLIRLNSNGTRDTSFNVGLGVNRTEDIEILSGGKILIGGSFLSYNGTTSRAIARLNSNGSLDTSFAIGSGFDGVVQDITVQSDNKILVGGWFDTYQGYAATKVARLNSDGSRDTSFTLSSGFNWVVNTVALNTSNGRIFAGGEFTSFGSTPAGYFVSLYGDNPVVSLPNSKVSTVINDAFTTQGYTTTADGTFVGSTPISLTDTDGSIPTDISILNDNIQLSLTENTQIQDSSSNNYRGTILAPSTNIVNSANDKEVFSSFNVGTNSQVLALNGGQARITVPVNGLNEGDSVNVYYSTDNGVSWTLDSTTTVINNNGSHYVEISTNHLGDFVITSPGNTRTFNINNGDTYTLTGNVNLNISVDPVAKYMRFSNDDITWTDWETYSSSKSRNLGNEGGTKTVFVEFDTDGDGDGDIKTSDSILYYVWSIEINSGDLKTTSLDVSLSVKVSPIPAQLMIYDEELGGSWESYVGDIERDWTLPVITPEEPGKGGEDTGSGKIEPKDIAGSIISTSTGGLVERYIYVDIDTDGDGVADIHANDSILYGSDITAPIPSISYSTTSPTNSNVIATISFNEPTTITNNSGSASYEFTNNGSFTFEFTDTVGNTSSATATVSWILPRQSSNGGGDTMQKDICIDGDESPSYYDGMCVAKDTNTTLATATMADAYKRAFENGITTKPSIEEAAMDIAISRAELAKMVSQYATEIKNKTPDTSASCIFTDIADVTPDLIPYIEESCQLGIMGRNSDGSIATSFNPYGLVTRGEFATVLSRVLWGNKYDGATEYYAGHIAALYNAGIIATTDPLLIEARGYVMLMMMRASMITD